MTDRNRAAPTGDPSDAPTGDPTPAPADRRAMAVSLLLTAALDIAAPLLTFAMATDLGASNRVAYLASGIGPLIMILITWWRARALSGASIVILIFLLLSTAATLIGGDDERLLLAKDALVTGGFGAVCLLSLLLPRPLMFYFGAKFATDGTKQGLAFWSGLWQYPTFRRSQYLITTAWGVGFLIEAALRILVAYQVDDFQSANTIVTILPFVFVAGLITFSVQVGRRTKAAATRSRVAVPAAQA